MNAFAHPSGPGGLPGGPITLRGDGEPGSPTDLGMLAQVGGAVRHRVRRRPGRRGQGGATDRLGPRYTITWRFPDPAGGKDRTLRQRVWPYAAGGPVSFTLAGQAVLDTTSIGGWYQGFNGVRAQLIELGLPNRQPRAPATAASAGPAPASRQPAPATTQPAASPRVAAVVAGLLVLVTAAGVPLRRRLGRRPATAPLTSAQLAAPTGAHPPRVLRVGHRRAAGMGSQPRARPVADQDVARATTRRQRTRRRASIPRMAAMAGSMGGWGPGNWP